MGASSEASAGLVDAAAVQRVGKGRLLGGFAALVRTDRCCTADLLVYIGEIDRRKLYLEHAYPSMFAFCTKRFRMSEAVAAKRIRAGRAACAFPCILGMVRRGELHLSGVHQLAGHLTEENHREVLRRAKHRSMREIDELVAEIAPKPDVAALIRAVPVGGGSGAGQAPLGGVAREGADEGAVGGGAACERVREARREGRGGRSKAVGARYSPFSSALQASGDHRAGCAGHAC